MSVLTNCKNCGAPLRDMQCDYCGTDYRDPWERIRVKEQKIIISPRNTKTVAAMMDVNRFEIEAHGDNPDYQSFLKRRLAGELVKVLADEIETETWTELRTGNLRIGTRLKIIVGD